MGGIKYNATMHNWSVDEEKFKKEDSEGHKIWPHDRFFVCVFGNRDNPYKDFGS